ncbi:MAG: TasA family protein [Haloarculaceae archaeon]
MSDRIHLTRRRLLGGLVAVGGASAAAGAGTMAYFSDAESSAGNAVQAGTLTLEFGGSAAFDFGTTLAPTESTTGSVTLVNTGSVAGSVDVDVTYSEQDASPNDVDESAQAVARNLTMRTLSYGGTDLTGSQGLSSTPTLHELATNDRTAGESTGNDLVDLPDPGGGTDFVVELELANVDSDFESDGVAVSFTFHLNQTDAQ